MVICAGSGGVGKTTTAAAVALGLAERGQRVAVVTIDPARRLANALGLDELDNEPRRVDARPRGRRRAVGDDARRQAHVRPADRAPRAGRASTRDEVFANRIYQQLSSAVAGSQEFTAIAKLYELDRDGDYDVLVLDTPPSRNALDFLDAPGRLTGFFQGRAIRVFMRPAGLSGRILGRGTGRRVRDPAARHGRRPAARPVGLLPLAGRDDRRLHRARRAVGELLEDPATTFLIVTAPRHDPVEEAIFFHRKLREAGMPFGGLVINRVHQPPEDELPAAVAADLGPALAERVGVATRRARRAGRPRRDERAAPARRARRPADDPRPRARRRRPRRRGPRARALTPVRVSSRSSSATRRSAGSRWPQSTSRSTARRQPPSSQTSASISSPGRTKPAIAARSSEIASRTRASSRGAVVRLGADRREPLGDAVVAGAVGVGEQRAGRQQPVRQRLDGAAALAAELEAPQRPGQLAGARRAARDEPAERAQRVLLLGAEQAVAGRAAQAAGERDRHPGAAVGARPGGRAERRARRRPTGAARSAGGAGGGRRSPARARRPRRSRAPARRRSRAGRRRGRRARRRASCRAPARARRRARTSSDSITRPSTSVSTTDSEQPA